MLLKLAAAVIAAGMLANPAYGMDINVIDGDTITACDPATNETRKIRLAHIDAPELNQAYGMESREALRQILLDVQKGHPFIFIQEKRKDRYGRFLSTIYSPGWGNINLEMVESGNAWCYKRKTGIYAESQRHARELKRGLWAYEKPESPWEFRKNGKRRARQAAQGRTRYILGDFNRTGFTRIREECLREALEPA